MRIILTVVIIFITHPLFSQTSVGDFDESLKQVVKKIADDIKLKHKTQVAVSELVDNNGAPSGIGRYIAEDISIHLTNVGELKVMDREHLSLILKEHKLKADGIVDHNTAIQLGKLSEVQVIITGTVIVYNGEIEVKLHAIETTLGENFSSHKEYLPVDKRRAVLLGISPATEASISSGNINDQTRKRVPLQYSEKYNSNSSNINNDCFSRNVGDYCFVFGKKLGVHVDLYCTHSESSTKRSISLVPLESSCIYSLPAGIWKCSYFVADGSGTHHKEIMVEPCKSKSIELR